jgi:hypothetical protein
VVSLRDVDPKVHTMAAVAPGGDQTPKASEGSCSKQGNCHHSAAGDGALYRALFATSTSRSGTGCARRDVGARWCKR